MKNLPRTSFNLGKQQIVIRRLSDQKTFLMDFIQQFLAVEPEALFAKTSSFIIHTPSPSFLIILVSICLIVLVMMVVFLIGVCHLCRNTTPSVSESPAESVTLVEGML